MFFCIISVVNALPYQFEEEIKWQGIQELTIDGGIKINRLVFDGAFYPSYLDVIPTFVKNYPVHTDNANVSCIIEHSVYMPLTKEEQMLLKDFPEKETTISSECEFVIFRKQPYVQIRIKPVRWNEEQSAFEKLVSFNIVINVEDLPERGITDSRDRINSVLAEGDWFKVKIDKSGIYKISYQELQEMGFDVSANPRKIAVFGNGGGILPEVNNAFRYDDLTQNPIMVIGEGDGNFDPNDYILFYGEGPVVWNYNPISYIFNFQTN